MAQSSFGVGDLLKWGVILGGGYLAYVYFLAPAIASATAPAAPAATPPAAPPATPPATPPAAPPAPAAGTPGPCPLPNLPSAMGGGPGCPPTTDSIATQQTKLLAAAGATATSTETASLWNWYYNTAYNLPTSTSWLLGDNGQPMTAAAYLALRKTAGFSGYHGMGGLGVPRRPVLVRGNYIPHGVPMAPPINYRRIG